MANATDNAAIPAADSLFFSVWGDKWACTKCYKTVANLEKKLRDLGVTAKNRPILIQIPTGKNAGKYTAIFPFQNGDNNWAPHAGFHMMG